MSLCPHCIKDASCLAIHVSTSASPVQITCFHETTLTCHLCWRQADQNGPAGTTHTAVTPYPFAAGDLLGMQWGTSTAGSYISIQAYLIVVMGG